MLLQQMDDRVSVHRDWFNNYSFHLVDSVEKLKNLVDMCIRRGSYSLDTETTGLDNRIYPDEYFEDGVKTRNGMRTVIRCVGVCISPDGENGYYVPLGHEPEDSGNLPWDEAWDELTRLVNSDATAIFHNLKYDGEILLPVTGKEIWPFDKVEDTLLLAKVLNPLHSSPAGLKQLTKIHFGVEMVELDELFTEERKEQLRREKKKYDFSMLHPREGLEYGCSDGIFTYKLFATLRPKMSGNDLTIYNLEKSFCNVVRRMERNRIHVDVPLVKRLHEECLHEIRNVGDMIRELIEERTGNTGKWVTLNVGSPRQMSEAMFTDMDGLRLKPLKEMVDGDPNADSDEDSDEVANKQFSINDEILKLLDKAYGKRLQVRREGLKDRDGNDRHDSLFMLILEYRHYDKMKGSYVGRLLESHDKYGDVRPRYNQMGTDTARLSSQAGSIAEGYSGINFMGIPRDSDDDKPELFKRIRRCIIPRPGKFMVKIDYAGEELRVVTNLSGDPIWTNSFLNEDGDVHSITTRTLYGKQDVSKDERTRGKRCNFAFIYGGGAGAISRNVGCSIEDGQRHMTNLRSAVPVLMGYVDQQKEYARKHKCIYTAFGRRIPIPTIDSPIRGIRAKAERCAINYTIQSTSADILKLAMCYVDKMIKQKGWDGKVIYVMTVHDEVVYEVDPDILQEAVTLLDEWMTLPWKLPKAHGRDWIVPLETEPGIDMSWKASYDFFMMTRGSEVNPKDIDDEGNYVGKLKKGHYYLDGRIYQEIPDFLKPHIRRVGDGGADAPPTEPGPETQVEERDPDVVESSPLLDDVQVDVKPIVESGREDTSKKGAPIPSVTGGPPQDPVVKRAIDPSSPTKKANGHFTWTMRAIPSDGVLRKLHAIIVLSEGDVALRMLNANGSVIVDESEMITVDPDRFRLLADLFGIG